VPESVDDHTITGARDDRHDELQAGLARECSQSKDTNDEKLGIHVSITGRVDGKVPIMRDKALCAKLPVMQQARSASLAPVPRQVEAPPLR
jgi:hypothetical protein